MKTFTLTLTMQDDCTAADVAAALRHAADDAAGQFEFKVINLPEVDETILFTTGSDKCEQADFMRND